MNKQLTTQAIEDIAAHAIDEMGDVFYEPDIDIDGYSPTTMRIEIQRIIVEAINTALEQAGAPLPDHLVMVLQRPDRGVA